MAKNGFIEVYPFATENVKGYFNKFDFTSKKVLTVGSSLDQAFNAYLLGAKNITVFDINPYTEQFYHLKKQAILELDRESLYAVMTSSKHLQFFAQSKEIPMGRIKVSKDQLPKSSVFNANIYLSSDEEYNRLRQIIKHQTPEFVTGDVFEIEKSKLDSQFDIIILSNLLQYITSYYPSHDPFQVLKDTFPKLTDLLEDDGVLQLLYLYSLDLETIKNNTHPLPTYRLKTVNETLSKKLSIGWFPGILQTYSKDVQDAIITYKKER